MNTISPSSSTRIGSTLRGKWTLERLLGEGGMASVYVARHTIGRLDAIKILHPALAATPQLRAAPTQRTTVSPAPAPVPPPPPGKHGHGR